MIKFNVGNFESSSIFTITMGPLKFRKPPKPYYTFNG